MGSAMAVTEGHLYVNGMDYVSKQGQLVDRTGIDSRLLISGVSFVNVLVNAARLFR